MPQVPRYQTQIEETALPSIKQPSNAPLEAFGGGAALERTQNALESTLHTAANIAIKEKQKADEVAVMGADYKLATRQSAWEQSTSKMMGQSAAMAPDVVKQGWEKDATDIESELSNDDQKAAYRSRAIARSLQLNDYVNKHVSNELTRFDKEQTEAYVANARTDAVRHPYEPDRIGASLMQQVGTIKQHALRVGEAPELTKQKITEAYQKTNLGVIDKMIADENFDLAESVLNSSKQYFTGDEQRGVQDLIASGRKKKEEKDKKTKDDFDKELFIRTLPGENNPLTYSELLGYAKEGKLERAQYDALKNRLFNVNDDDTIPRIEKTARLHKISQMYQELSTPGWLPGKPEVSQTTMLPIEEVEGNERKKLLEFRRYVAESAPYLTEGQERSFIMATQRDYDDEPVKAGLFRQLMNKLRNMKIEDVAPYINPVLNTLSSKSTPQQTADAVKSATEKAIVTVNANNPVKLGDTRKNLNGVSFECVGFDERGKPLWKRKD